MGDYRVEAAIIAIAVLEGFALFQGINGAGLAGALAAIAGLGGYYVGTKRASAKSSA